MKDDKQVSITNYIRIRLFPTLCSRTSSRYVTSSC